MDQIFSRESMRKRGRQAFTEKRGRDAHNMNPGVLAIADWQAGWDEAAAAAKVRPIVSPQSHATGARVSRIDVRQCGGVR